MGVYSEYLDKRLSFQDLTKERKSQLKRISELRGRDILVYAADERKAIPYTPILYEDLLHIEDQLNNLKGKSIDVILETTGGSGEVAEDIVRLLRGKYDDVAFIIPGMAKSAGTIMVMSGNDILMGPSSSLGPIDAQLFWQGKQFSAEAFLEGLNKIKEETDKDKALNRAYIPILQNISPGDIQHARNALNFAEKLVTEWLAVYKFKEWEKHSSTGKEVTRTEREKRANQVARELCNHGRWLTHARSIKIEDLERMRVKITDFSKEPELSDAIIRYYTLMRMTFDSNIYKIFETVDSQVYRYFMPPGNPPMTIGKKAIGEFECPKCHNISKIQLNFEKDLELEEGCIKYPPDDIFKCSKCNEEHNLGEMRRQLELQVQKKVVTDEKD
ncbi:MAG: Clp protease ClpP [Candidatus Altiarchaeota archaeon]